MFFLDEYARSRPDATAMQCAQRTTTYRKLSSRIERAASRLQGEWRISPGATVAYCGSGHQDAVVLYLALLRCGIDLMIAPPESGKTAALLSRHSVSLALNDAGGRIAGLPDAVPVFPLHEMIATRCEHQFAPAPGQGTNRLRRCPDDGDVMMAETQSSEALFARIIPRCETERIDAGRLFDHAVFAPVVLSVLAGGGIVHIA